MPKETKVTPKAAPLNEVDQLKAQIAALEATNEALETENAEQAVATKAALKKAGDSIKVKGLQNHKCVKIVGTGGTVKAFDKATKTMIDVPERKTITTEIKFGQITHITAEEWARLTNDRLPQPIVEFAGG